MKNQDTILAIIDPTKRKQDALEQAHKLAKALNKKLELFICTHNDSLVNYKNIIGEKIIETSKKLTMEKLTEVLEEMIKPLRQDDLEVSYDLSWDRPLDEGIIRKAMQSNPFLIVKDTHYHSKFSRFLFGHTDWNLIKQCPYPILFVKSIIKQQHPMVISAINPINDEEQNIDKKILMLGDQITKALDANHKVFHCVAPLTMSFVGYGDGSYSESLKDQNSRIKDLHKNRLNLIAQEYEINENDVIFLDGEAKDLLVDVAMRNEADLVIMGSQTHTHLATPFIGSTTEAVLDELNCNVLVLKPDEFKTSVSEQAPPEYPQVMAWPM